ncbi:MAG: [Fe-Fe] hydrogenase large subunit C-terminal domain-containing protein [Candidatus Peribacteraceae bacterium]
MEPSLRPALRDYGWQAKRRPPSSTILSPKSYPLRPTNSIPLDTLGREVTVFLNGKSFVAREGEDILTVALRSGFQIPHYCTHPDLPVDANCRTCLVEVEETGAGLPPNGERSDAGTRVVTSCTLKAAEGLRVLLDTPQVIALRTQNMELLFGEYSAHSPRIRHGYYSKTLEEMKRFGVGGKLYKRDDPERGIHRLGTAAEFDPALCIGCNKCVEICQLIGISHLTLEGRGSKTRVGYNHDPANDCIYCGQCTAHCPVEAVREQSHLEQVEEALRDPSITTIVQSAPSIRTSIGEGWGVPYGTDLTGQLVTAYRQLGFDKVFDVSMGADITTMVEAEELVRRLRHKWDFEEGKRKDPPPEGPMFSSCCPGWVKFAEFYKPDLLPQLTAARSPHIHSGGAYKTWWAEKSGIDPAKVRVISVMPCTSKKYEAGFEHLAINGHKPVDFVLTTRELIALLKTRKIDLPKLEPGTVDTEGTYSGAGAIYGATGGVMESALRTAYWMLTGQDIPGMDFMPARGFEGSKRGSLEIGGKRVNVAVVAMPKNMWPLLRALKKDPGSLDYVEMMACPGGCIGGGGQPIPNTFAIVKERIAGLYVIDKNLPIRTAHGNPVVQEFMAYAKAQPEEKRNALLYRSFSAKKKGE